VVTNPDLLYLRFHGRNARGWRSGNMQKQFDYDYSPDELQTWSAVTLPKMAARARAGIIFFNNHVRAQAPRNARTLMAQLESQGFPLNPTTQRTHRPTGQRANGPTDPPAYGPAG
jgi:uncharacterized protein YecE (DUF72 family)